MCCGLKLSYFLRSKCVLLFVVAFPADKVACFAVVQLLVDYFLDFINFVLLNFYNFFFTKMNFSYLAVILLFVVFFFIGRRICVLLFLEKSVDFTLGQVFGWLPGIVFAKKFYDLVLKIQNFLGIFKSLTS